MPTTSERVFSSYQEHVLIEAIKEAEMQTSGEIRLHVETECNHVSAIERAKELFTQLKMSNTKDRNGILFYVAYNSRKFAIWGDQGIHDKVHQEFWDIVRNEAINSFKEGRIVEGLVSSILKCGTELKRYFPYQKDDTNELPNTISY